MKKIIAIAILLLPALSACTDNSQNEGQMAASVVLSRDKVDLQVGESAAITATVLPESLGMGVTWSVLDPAFAEVQEDGTITAKAEGVTYVVATSTDGAKKAACMVSVNPPVRYKVSITDELGNPLEAVYGYPGMSIPLHATTTDGETHHFTWSVEDASAFSILADEGLLTLGAAPATDDAYVYDASSYVKVATEDGYGCRIPVRSNILKGVRVDQTFYYQPTGTLITVESDNSYPISVLYESEFGQSLVPANVLDVELTNTKDFTLQKVSDAFALITGSSNDVSTKLLVSMAGGADKVELATFVIDRIYPIQASLYYTSSSTLTYTWTEGINAEDDISKSYNISLYKDADATQAFLSYDIPAEHVCWKGAQPRFVFSGLDAGTEYWFRVTDTSEGAVDVVSDLISGTTDAFTIVEPGDTPAAAGDVLLAEDFSELYWYGDEISQAAGYEVGTTSAATFQDRTVNSFVGYTGQYNNTNDAIITKQKTAIKAPGFRLGNWANGQYARMYLGPGFVYLSTYSYANHLITPALNNIPEGMSATLQVTVHAAGYASGAKAVLAVQPASTSFNLIKSGTETNKNKLKLEDNCQTITYTGGLTTLGEFTVTLENVQKGDRIAFGPPSETVKSNNNMMIISDMTITLVELK